ncbi:MAG: hypothetical protein AAGE86_07175 [Pseudomonadota bacterium]
MSENYEPLVEAALDQLKQRGVDTGLLESRLKENAVTHVVIGRWPPEGRTQAEAVQDLIKTRAALQETLDLMLATSCDVRVARSLNRGVKDLTMKLTDSIPRASIDLPGEEHESIVGRWPPD